MDYLKSRCALNLRVLTLLMPINLFTTQQTLVNSWGILPVRCVLPLAKESHSRGEFEICCSIFCLLFTCFVLKIDPSTVKIKSEFSRGVSVSLFRAWFASREQFLLFQGGESSRDQQTFPVKGQIVNVLGFVGHITVSVVYSFSFLFFNNNLTV